MDPAILGNMGKTPLVLRAQCRLPVLHKKELLSQNVHMGGENTDAKNALETESVNIEDNEITAKNVMEIPFVFMA